MASARASLSLRSPLKAGVRPANGEERMADPKKELSDAVMKPWSSSAIDLSNIYQALYGYIELEIRRERGPAAHDDDIR